MTQTRNEISKIYTNLTKILGAILMIFVKT